MTTKIGRLSQLDRSALLRIQAGCNYINAQVTRLRRRVLIATGVGVIVALVVYALMWRSGERDIRVPMAVVFLISAYFGRAANKELKQNYKGIVVRRVVEALGQGITYRAESGFTREDFTGMHLFDRRPERWLSEDEVTGRKDAVTYSLHEVRASYQSGSGRNRREVIIFRGLIVRLDFNKHFAGHTIVVSRAQAQRLGGLLGEATTRHDKEIVRLESPDFERTYCVYSTDQQQARYVLTPKMMELILEARAVLGEDLRMSFHDNSMFVTVPQTKDRFEASLFGAPVTPETTVGDLVEVIGLAERLIETLELETRIWSRV